MRSNHKEKKQATRAYSSSHTNCGLQCIHLASDWFSQQKQQQQYSRKRSSLRTLWIYMGVHCKVLLITLFALFLDPVSDDMSDAEILVNFLVQLCDTNTMKTIAAETLMMKIVDVERTFKERKLSSTASSSFQSSVHSSVDRMDSSSSFSSVLSSDSMDEVFNRTFLEFLMDFVTQFEFPQKIVTFLLHLLPNTEYKVLLLSNNRIPDHCLTL